MKMRLNQEFRWKKYKTFTSNFILIIVSKNKETEKLYVW